QLVEDEPEDSAVRGVDREPGGAPARAARHGLSEQRHVRVVVAQQPLVERLGETPDDGRDRAGGSSSQARLHEPVSIRRRNAPPPIRRSVPAPAASRSARSDVTSQAPGWFGTSRISQSSALSRPVPTSVVRSSRRSSPTSPPVSPSKTTTSSCPLRSAHALARATSCSSLRFGHCERWTL